MSASSDTIQTWPAARQGATRAIRHPAWEEARNAVLDLAAEGPVTIALVGEAGTGKTWLLRELAGSLGDHGFPSTMLMQGDLPAALSEGAALLVDEALRMPDAVLHDMLRQRHGVVVLTDMEGLGDRVAKRIANPVVIRLRSLRADEVADFTAEWLERAGLPSTTLEPGALSQLALHGRGSVRLVAKLLGAAVAMRATSGRVTVSAADFDRMVDFRLRGLELPPEPAPTPTAAPAPPQATPEPPRAEVPQPEAVATAVPRPFVLQPVVSQTVVTQPVVSQPVVPQRRRPPRALMAGIAVAACATLVWGLRPGPSEPFASAQPGASVTEKTPLPPLQPADLATPSLAAIPRPAPAAIADALLAPATAPLTTAALDAPPQAETTMPTTVAAVTPRSVAVETTGIAVAETPGLPGPEAAPVIDLPGTPPPRLASAASIPTGEAPPAAPTTAPAPEQARPPRAAGAPGMVLIAQRGETLQSMYKEIYRDRVAPPFADVLAVNPRPFRPGAMVIFPAPPGGWDTAQ